MIKWVILLAIPVGLWEGWPLIRQRKWKELITFGVLIGVALSISLGKTLGLPTPIELLGRWFQPLGRAIFKQF